MGRDIRFVPPETMVEVSNRIVQGIFLLVPSAELNRIIYGVLGRAQRRFPVKIHEFNFQSNHFHILLTPGNAKRLSRFMAYFESNLSKEIGRLYGWKGSVWGDRYNHIIISEEEEIQLERMDYVLSQGCKDGLVESPRRWPGATSVRARLAGDESIEGLWFDRTEEWKARRRKGASVDPLEFASKEHVKLSPIPCWRDLSSHEYRARYAARVRVIEEETAARHRTEGTRPLGVEKILSFDPHHRPKRTKKSRKPRFFAAVPEARRELTRAFESFLEAYGIARDCLKKGLPAFFPAGSFPPPLPFVPIDPVPT